MKKTLFTILAIAALVSACNTKENITSDPKTDGVPFIATVQAGSEAYMRAVTESGGNIAVAFNEGDLIALVYEVGSSIYKTDAEVTSVDGSGKATISATLQAGVVDGTAVTLIYPSSVATAGGSVAPSALSTQDGALSSARDVRKGTGSIKVDGTATLAGGATLDAQFSICKFSVKDVDGTNDLEVSSFVVKDGANNVITTVTPASDASTLYVSLPTTSELLWFEAVAEGKPYIAKGTASLTAGNYYTPTIKMATILNVIGANGKFYKNKAGAVAAGTTASAIIASLGEDTVESGYPHGLAIAMAVAGGTRKWQGSNGLANPGQYSTYALALAAKESGSVLSADKNNETDYPAFYYALNNSITLASGITNAKPSSGTSNWFLPSVYQFNLIIKGLRGTSDNLTNMDNSALRGTDLYYTMTSVGYNSSAPWNSTGNYVLTSTEVSDSQAWTYCSSGKLEAKNKTGYSGYVVSTLAF
ncbi:MAG: hypothetical protein IJV01_00700 [Bacteroidales bacterium]|nr:hypothetical protein [Bacteroidales bacterium]